MLLAPKLGGAPGGKQNSRLAAKDTRSKQGSAEKAGVSFFSTVYFMERDVYEMNKLRNFLGRKDIVFSAKRYGIDALGAMAQGLFCSLLVGTIVKTLGQQLGLGFLVDVGTYASAMSGPAMAIAIGYALKAPALVLFSLATVGYAANAIGGAGGPLAVYVVAVVTSEIGKAISKETKIDILVTPLVTILVGVGLAWLVASPIGTAARAVGQAIVWATELQPFLMGILVSVLVGVALTLPISSAAICASFGLVGLAGGAAVAGCCASPRSGIPENSRRLFSARSGVTQAKLPTLFLSAKALIFFSASLMPISFTVRS